MTPRIAPSPQLLTVAQAASLLQVSARAIRRWIAADKIPFLKLPGGGYRIPQGALLASLRANHDLAGELRALDERYENVDEHAIARALR